MLIPDGSSSSLTDTSYFPTEDLNDVPEQPTGADASAAGVDNRQLAFLGFTFRRYEGAPNHNPW